jgi:hypothetical protein
MRKELLKLEKRRSRLLDRWIDAESEEKTDLLVELIDIDEKLAKKEIEKIPRFATVPRYFFRS